MRYVPKRKNLPAELRTEVLLKLKRWKLYAPFEVAATFVSKEENPRLYERFRNNVGKMALRRGDIKNDPSNALLNPETLRPITQLNDLGEWETVLEEGIYNAWFGFTWQRQITSEEKKTYYEMRAKAEQGVIIALSEIWCQKMDALPAPSNEASAQGESHRPEPCILTSVALWAVLILSLLWPRTEPIIETQQPQTNRVKQYLQKAQPAPDHGFCLMPDNDFTLTWQETDPATDTLARQPKEPPPAMFIADDKRSTVFAVFGTRPTR